MTSKILCPTDGTDHADIGVRLAAEISLATGGQLTICLVNLAVGGARGPTINHLRDEDAKKILADAEAIAKSAGAKDVTTVEVVAREAAPAITTYAGQHAFTHIVMGTGDKRGLKRLMLGSVAAEVVNHAHCTVTVAR